MKRKMREKDEEKDERERERERERWRDSVDRILGIYLKVFSGAQTGA